MLRSGNTLLQSLDALREIAESFLQTTAEKVAKVRTSPADFAMLAHGVTHCLDRCLAGFKSTISTAVPIEDAPLEARALRLFGEMRINIERKLAIQRFAFKDSPKTTENSPHARQADDMTPQVVEVLAIPSPGKNIGGRPRAAFWDQLWVEMAAQLYEGTIQPTQQARIEDAMKLWLAQHNYECADSTVRDRARLLWKRLERPET
jgi:hypothetical protein